MTDTSREAVERLARDVQMIRWPLDEGCKLREGAAATLRVLLAERDRYAEREAHFAKALGVADGGQYRNDWDAAIRKALAVRDTAVAQAERWDTEAADMMAQRDAAVAQRDAERHEVRNGFLEGYEAGWAAALENAASETPYDEPQCDAAWSDSDARVRLAHIRFPDAPTGGKP